MALKDGGFIYNPLKITALFKEEDYHLGYRDGWYLSDGRNIYYNIDTGTMKQWHRWEEARLQNEQDSEQ